MLKLTHYICHYNSIIFTGHQNDCECISYRCEPWYGLSPKRSSWTMYCCGKLVAFNPLQELILSHAIGWLNAIIHFSVFKRGVVREMGVVLQQKLLALWTVFVMLGNHLIAFYSKLWVYNLLTIINCKHASQCLNIYCVNYVSASLVMIWIWQLGL